MRSGGMGGGGCGHGRGKARGMGRGKGMVRRGGCGMERGAIHGARKGMGGNSPYLTRPAPSSNRYPTSCGPTEAIEEKRSIVAVVEKEKCICCGACVDVCPENAIILRQTALITIDKCIGCGTCVPECPNDAISLMALK